MVQYKTSGITVFQSDLYETTSTVIESKEAIIIVDPNWLPKEVLKIRQYVDEVMGDKKLYVILTHSDFDHMIGVGAFPEAIIIASEKLKFNSNKQKIIDEINTFDNTFYLSRPYPIDYPKVNITVKENETHLQIGDLDCIFYLAPGHTTDGLFFYIKQLDTIIVGDYLSDVEFPFITSSYSDYLETIKLMKKVIQTNKIQLLIPGHGKVTHDIEERIEFTLWYLDKIAEQKDIEAKLRKKFSYYDGMKDAHKNNLKLAKGRDTND